MEIGVIEDEVLPEGRSPINVSLDKRYCCEKNCSNLLAVDDQKMCKFVMRLRYPSKRMRKQFILDYLITHSTKEAIVFLLNGIEVCRIAWISVYGLTESLFKKALRLYKAGKVDITLIPKVHRPRHKSMIAIGWMNSFFQMTCEKMPNSSHWYLPSFLTKDALYNQYKESGRETYVSRSQFHDLWLKYFKHVTIPPECRFTKCDLCTALNEEKQKTKTSAKRARLEKMFKEHNDLQMHERMSYYKRIENASSFPNDYLSIIIDSMDQSKLLVPRLFQQRKATADAWFLRTHLIAAIVHGVTCAGAVDMFQFPHDSNATCNFLLRVLSHLDELPRILTLQLDNCWRENKNRYLFGMVALFVKHKIFHQVYIHFLMKGHTHEDIDQLFSQYANDFLKNKNVLTIEDLMERWEECAARKSPKKNPLVYFSGHMFDLKSWLEPHLADIHGHTGPHAFKFTLNADNEPVMFYKQWSNAEEIWQPLGEGINIFNSEPVGTPSFVMPTADKMCLPQVQNSVNRMLGSAAVRIFSNEHRAWWSSFWENIDDYVSKIPDNDISWPFSELLKKAESRDQKYQIESNEDIDDQDLLNLAEIIDNPPANVYVGRKPNENRSNRQVVEVEETSNLNIGQMVAVYQSAVYEMLQKLPLIGEVVETMQDESNVFWVRVSMWQGSYTGKWSKPKKPYFEWLTRDAVILYDFNFTNGDKLHSSTKEKLRELYSEYLTT